ncbi:MAG TPA: right-handed parallel beta-helix repeat-containing protein [Thermomicrobiales bacterium]|jgi:hypothetical protein|nr:right-handed parallel beta-helix repeat-containing protein [Thermomicrobiales bacterium]
MPPPATIVVDELRDGSLRVGDINRLNRLVGIARPGQTVLIESGDYRGTLEVHAGITLRPDDGPVRIWSTVGPAVRVHGCGATLDGLELVSRNGDAVVIQSTDVRRTGPSPSEPVVRLEACTVDGGRAGVVMGTARVRLDVIGGQLSANGGPAISLPDNGTARLADVVVESRGDDGIHGGDGVRLGLDGVTITHCARAGIRLGARAAIWGDARPSTILDNIGTGVVVGADAKGDLRGARISGNGGYAIVDPSRGITLTGADLSGITRGERSTGAAPPGSPASGR